MVAILALCVVGCSESGADVSNENGSENNAGNGSGGDNEDDKPIDIPYEELPYFCDVENLAGWSNARICKDGNAIFTSQDAATQQVTKAFMLIQMDTLGLVTIHGEFDEIGFPKYLSIDNTIIFIDDHTETTFNATVFVDGKPVWTAANLELSTQASRAWDKNTWVRNACAVGGVITSSIGIGIGVVLTESIVGMGVGIPTIAAASYSLYRSLDTLFGPPEHQMDPFVVDLIKEFGVDYLCDNLSKSNKRYLLDNLKERFGGKLGALTGLTLVDIALFGIDKMWGDTIIESEKQLALTIAHRSYVVETGVAKNVTEHTAELWGYVSPEALAPLGNYAEIEYGIVVYPTADPSNRMHKEYIVGDGGAFSLLFRGLEYDTEYSYFVYYNDKTNALPRYGQTRTFKTIGEDAIREMLIKFYHDTGGDNWTRNDNWCSDKPIDEWYGISYRDSDGDGAKELHISLSVNNLTGNGDLSGCTALMSLGCYNNQCSSLNVSGCTELEVLYCHSNQLMSLNVSGCTALNELYCYNNQLTNLEASGCTALRVLGCYENQLTNLDVSSCTAVAYLICSENQLTSLNVSGCTALWYLNCSDNQLTSLDVSGCTALEMLFCVDNQLSNLNVSGCTALESLYCEDNPITQMITEPFLSIPYFHYDHRYAYNLDEDMMCWGYTYSDHHGWYYPDEPRGIYIGN